MPPKPAQPAEPAEMTYVKACLRYYKEPMTKINFDFDAIAKDTGLATAQAA
jgi:hypothetical protein